MVNFAISIKSVPTYSLWAGGNEGFYLPMLDTSSITAFSASNFSQNLKGVGLDLSSVTSFAAVFSAHKAIETISLKNSGNVRSFANLLESCKTVRTITIDNLKSCYSLMRFANEATQLREINFGTVVEADSYERAFCNCTVLKNINGTLSLKLASNINMIFTNCYHLEEVRFKEDSISQSIDFLSCTRLSKESMISVFRGLMGGANGTLSVSLYAFENDFSQEEREAWSDYVTKTKGWQFDIA